MFFVRISFYSAVAGSERGDHTYTIIIPIKSYIYTNYTNYFIHHSISSYRRCSKLCSIFTSVTPFRQLRLDIPSGGEWEGEGFSLSAQIRPGGVRHPPEIRTYVP